jgi:lipid-A-disaccharide synthase
VNEVMFIAGEASGDLLAAELAVALRAAPAVQAMPFAPRFFGAGGPKMAEAGVELAFDLTAHAVVGLAEVLKNYFQFRALFRRLLDLACARQPDLVVLVDFSGFNRRFARALRRRLEAQQGPFHNWCPKIVQYVSPQVWASRPGRAKSLARDFDLLICLFPFEKAWYAQRVPQLRVEFVGHPVLDRYGAPRVSAAAAAGTAEPPLVLLLPGSRVGDLERHLPVMLAAARLIAAWQPAQFSMVLPNEALAAVARRQSGAAAPDLKITVGGLAAELARGAVAIASTGTVTLECALFGVPTVALRKTSPITYHLAKRMVKVKHLAMPNLLANEAVYPEFIQDAATPENLAREAGDLLANAARRQDVQAKLRQVVASLGGPGASARAAAAVLDVFRTV